jgi:hypothetical protein
MKRTSRSPMSGSGACVGEAQRNADVGADARPLGELERGQLRVLLNVSDHVADASVAHPLAVAVRERDRGALPDVEGVEVAGERVEDLLVVGELGEVGDLHLETLASGLERALDGLGGIVQRQLGQALQLARAAGAGVGVHALGATLSSRDHAHEGAAEDDREKDDREHVGQTLHGLGVSPENRAEEVGKRR